jgi:radical SAM superfamily enzyme YgiQ (UPF0313 family)
MSAVKFERPEIIRPPSEHAAYFLPLTSGCSNNSCTYCSYYGCKLGIRDMDEVKGEIDAMSLYVKNGIRIPAMQEIVYLILRGWDGKRVFLQDGDAMVYPYPGLVDILGYLNERFPNLERIASYATPQDILRRSVDELKELGKNKLGIVYMGVESGDNGVLKKIGKGVTHEQLVEAGRKVKASGILLSVTVILGLGGTEGSPRHAMETARVLSEIDPDYAGALTLTLRPGRPLYEEYARGKFSLISPFEFLRELKLIIENAVFSHCFFSSMHASNYVSVRGTLPRDKARMLQELEYVLKKKDKTLLRPEFLRGL